MLEVEVSVDLRRRQVGVPEQFLDGTQVARRLKDVRSKGMAQLVRMDVAVEPLTDGALRDPLLNRAHTDWFALQGGEDPVSIRLRQVTGEITPAGQRGQCVATDRHDPLLVTLADDSDQALGGIEPMPAGGCQLADPQSRGIAQLEQCAIAQVERFFSGNLEQLTNLVRVQGAR